MPEYRHPTAPRDVPGVPPAEIHVSRAENATVEPDGCFEAPESVARAVAKRHGVTLASMRTGVSGDTCTVEKADGETCGRDLPCPYHDDAGGEN